MMTINEKNDKSWEKNALLKIPRISPNCFDLLLYPLRT